MDFKIYVSTIIFHLGWNNIITPINFLLEIFVVYGYLLFMYP